jgi:glycosyltransferase involved in cell wall biosynthesis
VPVLFVQPDGEAGTEEPTEVEGLTLVHAGGQYEEHQLAVVRRVLERRDLCRPLLWIYNPNYEALAKYFPDAVKVYHATEDYFTDWGHSREVSRRDRWELLDFRRRLVLFLQTVDLVVSVTHGVAARIRSFARYGRALLVLENGCDFEFWRAAPSPADGGARKLAIYQGAINRRLDVALLAQVMDRLHDWEFRFCGPVDALFRGWDVIRQRPNVRYLGNLHPGALRQALHASTVGLIPFVQEPYISRQSLPLKAFEYAACGLPVVSVPIEALASHRSIFRFASTADEFAGAIVHAGETRFDPLLKETRRKAAQRQGYDQRFEELGDYLCAMPRATSAPALGARARALGLEVGARWNRWLFEMERSFRRTTG